MGGVKTVFFVLLLYIPLTKAQTLFFEENFNCTVGDISGQNSWTTLGTDNVDNLNVVSGNLSYTDYSSGAVFNSVHVISGGSKDECVQEFHTANIISGVLYLSLLIKVNSSGTDGNNDGYFLCLMSESGTTNFCRLSVVDAGSGNLQFGIQKNTDGGRSLTTSSYSNSGFPTFLLVMKYDFSTETTSLFVNPALSGSEPGSTDAINNTGSAISDLRRIQIRQGGGATDCDVQIDGIRISDAWSQAPLPVELISFSALVVDEGIKLNWRTETEVNNYGFDVERSSTPLGTIWKTIGFVKGNGNSNSPKEYSFIDKDITGGKYFYRLKQIDNDGTFTYSKVIDIEADKPLNYKLDQNYPNPFNPVTTIKFTIPEANKVTLKVFNVIGEEVAKIVNQWMEAGTHEINFDGTGLNSGIYFYRIKAGDFVTIRKMILLK